MVPLEDRPLVLILVKFLQDNKIILIIMTILPYCRLKIVYQKFLIDLTFKLRENQFLRKRKNLSMIKLSTNHTHLNANSVNFL